MITFSLLTIGLLLGVLTLIPIGLRAGERSGEALVLTVRVDGSPRALQVSVVNPGAVPVIAGLSLRRPGLRLHLEGGSYTRVRRGARPELLPGAQMALGAVAPGEIGSFTVLAPPGLKDRAELVTLVGQNGRLRTLHRLVALPSAADFARPQPAWPSIRVD